MDLLFYVTDASFKATGLFQLNYLSVKEFTKNVLNHNFSITGFTVTFIDISLLLAPLNFLRCPYSNALTKRLVQVLWFMIHTIGEGGRAESSEKLLDTLF